MPHTDKPISAKGAWARMSASNRRLREALETIGALAGNEHIQSRAGEGAQYLRMVYELAAAALITDDRERRAARP